MKRLQFRRHDEIFETRELALEFFRDITTDTSIPDSNLTVNTLNRSTQFGTSLYAEPMVARYRDGEEIHVIFAIGVGEEKTEYHLIDSHELAETIQNEILRATAAEAFLSGAVITEMERATAAENFLSGAVDTEIARAMEAEAFLSGAVDTEREERIKEDEKLQQQITDNIAKLSAVEASGANILEEFALINAKGEELGEHIKIYKDRSLVTSQLGYKGVTGVTKTEENKYKLHYDVETYDTSVEYLYLIYRDENGDLQFVGIDFEQFLMEAEYGNGLKLIEHVLHIKIKDGEKYLDVNEDGLQTVNIDEAIAEAVKDLSEELHAKIDAEIERSVAADEYISGLTADFSAATVNELNLVNSALTVETERAIAAEAFLSGAVNSEMARAMESEAFLSGAINTEREERIAEDDTIKAEVLSNKIVSKDLVVDKQITGTSLTIQTDEITITKLASASTIYDTNVAVLGSLLTVKKVKPNTSNIKSRYELQGADGQLIGDPIEMPIESALVDVKQGKVGDAIDPSNGNYKTFGDGDTTMNFVYRLENGTYELVQVVVSEYFTDSHFGKGLNNQDGVVSLKEGDGNEYLIIGEDTIAVVGVSKDIHDAEDRAKIYTDSHYNASTAYTDTKYNDSVAHTNEQINSVRTDLNAEIANRGAADATLQASIDNVNTNLLNAIQSEADARNAEIQAETANREDADATLQASIDNVNTNLLNAIQEEASARNTEIQAETANREAADAVLQTSIDSVNTNLLNAIQSEADARNAEIQAETANREAADADIIRKVETEVSERTQDVKEIREKLVFLENTDATLNTKIDNTRDVLLRDITSAYTKSDNDILNLSKVYADNIVKQSVDIINNEKVTDIVYNKETRYIQLLLANTNKTVGFDASDFIVDGMLSAVTFDERTNEMTFVWNTPEMSNIVVPLNKFVDQYKVSDDSVSFLKISDDNKISAIIDQNDSYANTLASTDYVKMSVETAQQTLSANVESRFEEVINDYNTEIQSLSGKVDSRFEQVIGTFENDLITLSGNVDSRFSQIVNAHNNDITVLSGNVNSRFEQIVKDHNNDITVLSGNIINYVDKADIALASRVSNNENAIATLNGNKTVVGSVLYNIENELNTFMLYHGVPITNTTFEDAKRHSLIKKINANGDIGYFASNLTNDMLHVSEEGEVNLNDYITNLHNRIKVLEAQLENFDRNVENIIKDTIKNYLVGTTNEIKVTEINEKLTIGFDDNAIFGEVE